MSPGLDFPAPPAFPERVVIEMTPLCNLACAMCPRHYAESGDGYIAEALWKRLVDEIADEAPETIVLPFWRGESLLHPDFARLTEYAAGKSLRMHISTNGELLDGKNAGALLACEFVTFSIHTDAGFARAREFLGLRKGHAPVCQISFVEGEPSVRLMKGVVSDEGLGGFDSVRLYEAHTVDGVYGRSSRPAGMERVYCRKLLDTIVIAYDGKVSRCNHVWDAEEILSARDLTIGKAWRSGRLSEIRGSYPDKYCGPCGQWTGHTRGESWRLKDGRVMHLDFNAPSAQPAAAGINETGDIAFDD